MSNYWEKRIAQIVDKQYNKSVEITGDLKRAYQQALREIEAAYEELYFRMLEDGEVSPLTQYKFNRYKNLEKTIVNELQKLGQKEVKMLNDISIESFVNLTEEVSELLNFVFEPLNMHQMAQKAFEMNWKGSNFSGRIWNNKQKLLTRLKKMVTDAVALGKSKDETVKELTKIFNVGFNDADRLVRTELMNILNQAQKDLYISNGYSKYTLLPHIDDRTSDRCKDIDESKEYLFSKAITGTNYPPLHPWCRTIAIPVIESNEMPTVEKRGIENQPSNDEYDILSDKKWLSATFYTQKKFDEHIRKHLKDYPGYTSQDYLNRARELLSDAISEQIEGFVDSSGFIYKYDKTTDDFAIGHPGGSISTLYKPDERYNYWQRERMKNEP